MRIGFTYDLKEDHSFHKDLPSDVFAELDQQETIDDVVAAIEKGGHEVVRIGNIRNLLSRFDRLDVDIVFNICEGLYTRNRESEVPALLNVAKIPFVGSDALTLGLTLDKALAKKIFISDGIPTPKFFIADKTTDLNRFKPMKFPLIVKPKYEGSSKGISDQSIVRNKQELQAQIQYILENYKQPAIVEEFIKGSEFTVVVIGNEKPQALPSVQIQILDKKDLGELIYTSRRVYNDDVQYVCPSEITKKLELTLRDLAIKAYQSVECLDFGRVDFRVDQRGRPFVLEVNPLPSLSLGDVFPLAAEAQGLTFESVIFKIIDFALQRHGLR